MEPVAAVALRRNAVHAAPASWYFHRFKPRVAKMAEGKDDDALRDVVLPTAVVEFIPPTIRWDVTRETSPKFFPHDGTFPFLGPALLPFYPAIVAEMKVLLHACTLALLLRIVSALRKQTFPVPALAAVVIISGLRARCRVGRRGAGSDEVVCVARANAVRPSSWS